MDACRQRHPDRRGADAGALFFGCAAEKACAALVCRHRIVGFADHKSAPTATQRVGRKVPVAASSVDPAVGEESEN